MLNMLGSVAGLERELIRGGKLKAYDSRRPWAGTKVEVRDSRLANSTKFVSLFMWAFRRLKSHGAIVSIEGLSIPYSPLTRNGDRVRKYLR